MLNISYNCLDRHLADGGDKVAYHWEGEPGDTRTITYSELHAEVCRLANALADLGVGKGDRVAIYMGMVPELPVAMLACARIGAVHSVVFGGFSERGAVRPDSGCRGQGDRHPGRCVASGIGGSSQGGRRCCCRSLPDDRTRRGCEAVRQQGDDESRSATTGITTWSQRPLPSAPEQLDAEDPLYILYTSGTTAKPKGIVHTQGGYLTQITTSHALVFDIKPDDVYWCAADIGWVTGHSYIVYAPLANHTTGIIYEGAPTRRTRIGCGRSWSATA